METIIFRNGRHSDEMKPRDREQMTSKTIEGPFGPARHAGSVTSEHIAAMYEVKCGVDVRRYFPTRSLDLYECLTTGYRFWRPVGAAGNEEFYRELSAAWADYYRDWRWEYGHLQKLTSASDALVEIGSGRGYFLRHIEGKVKSSLGLELNREAIANKTCRSEVLPMTVEEFSADHGKRFDVVCSFQVLEHIPEPDSFLRACLDCLAPSGRLIVSTPNHQHVPFARREDAFDLPPHHMGHFSPRVFAKVAERYGLTLERVFLQPQAFSMEAVTEGTGMALPYRTFRRLTTVIGQVLYRSYREPGAAMLVVMRKARVS
jgi:SAM-dependent methyltransferase